MESTGRPFLSPSPLPSPSTPASNNPPPPSSSSSKRVTISEPSSSPSSGSFTFNPETRSGSISNSNPPPRPVRFASARSDSARGSQREISDEEARFVHINQPDGPDPASPAKHPGNHIRTSKYSVLTFLPRNLFEQFHRVAYIYFLILIGLNQIPQLGVLSPAASILPLAFVLSVTAAKDGYEDWRRHRADITENNRNATVLVGSEFQPRPWKSIRVGEIIRVGSNETLPCDMVLLSTSDSSGVAYVQTINLDGESNLKTRYAKQETQLMQPDRVKGVIRCEKPNRNIYGFNGNVDVGGKRVSVGPGNVILRGCEVKNTEWVVGVVVYTGMETKVMLNSSGAPSKKSRLEKHMNRETIFLAVALFTLCSVVTLLGGLWLHRHEDQLDILPYYRKSEYSSKGHFDKYKYYGIGWEIVFTFFKSVIQFQVLIPIALFISMEIVRVGQAYFMIQDREMYHEESDSRFQCRALNINEDLGQVKYVFSDKTGTLTDNKMEFRSASVNGIDYGSVTEEVDGASVSVDGQIWRPKAGVKADPELLHLLNENHNDEANGAKDFILALAACNTIVPIVVDTPDPSLKLIDYQGESPDEQALVYAAAAYGFILIERTSGHIVIDVFGHRERYDVLGLHEFDSDRKRMSVIIGCPDKTVKLFVKGADNSMFGIIDKSLDLNLVKTTEAHLHKYSSLGLRTLVIGMRELTSAEFSKWQSSYEKASTALIGRGGLLKAVASSVECNLQLLGASGIEDKLQQGVPEAIESLRQAGIKVWVLTGDKQETAMSIGYSCRLLSNEMTQIIINSRNKESCKKSLDDALTMTQRISSISPSGNELTRIPLALIIDGTSLVYILESELEEMLFRVATACDVVLCCRVAPLQKAGIVALIKNRTNDMTLAIGDGANDVSMIQMADVGIGISGQEGRQAVMASDFAMGQFRFLVPLLLVHGHWNYQRMAYMILYNFYRNAVFVLMLFWYVMYTAFSLTTAITEWSSVLYSVIYTALPTIIVGILDKDLSRRTLLKYPQLYGSGQREERYNIKLFILTMLDTIWQSAAIFFLPFLAYRHSEIDSSSIGDLWTIAVVIIVNIHLSIDVFRWNWMTHASIWGCTIATLICVIVIDALPMLPGYWAIFNVMGTSVFWLCLVGIVVTAMIPRVVTKITIEYLTPSDIQVARELEKFGSLYEAAATEVPMSTFSNSRHELR